MNKEINLPMGYRDILDYAFSIHRKNIWIGALYLFIFSLIIFVATFLVVLLFAAIIIGALFIARFSMPDLTWAVFPPLFILVTISSFFGMIISFVQQSGLTLMAFSQFHGNKMKIGDMMGKTFKKMLRILGIAFAWISLALPGIFILGLMAFSYALNFITFSLTQQIVIGILLGLPIIAAFLWYSTIHMFALHAGIIEDYPMFQALKRSRQLVKGQFFSVFLQSTGISIIVGAIQYSLISFFALIAGIVIVLVQMVSSSQSFRAVFMMLVNTLQQPAQIITSLFITPIASIFITLLYLNQLIKKEGYDLKVKLKQLQERQGLEREIDNG